MSTKCQYVWLAGHQSAFDDLKAELSKRQCLANFDHEFEIRLETDASRKKDFCYVVLQNQNDEWRVVSVGSRYLKGVEHDMLW